MKIFPWARAMEIGLGHLKLGPRDFWRLTLPELAAAARGAGLAGDEGGAMTRAMLEGLAERFPDRR